MICWYGQEKIDVGNSWDLKDPKGLKSPDSIAKIPS